VAGRLIVEHLNGETLVYDTESNEAHALSGAGAAEFLAVEDEVSRREVLRKLALAGVAAAGTGAFVKTIVAPTAAQAQSLVCTPACVPGAVCCQPGANACCTLGAYICCPAGSAVTCCGIGSLCCPAGSAHGCFFPPPGPCTSGTQCCSNVCCNGVCCAQGQNCVAGLCT
jgi:hypothetical protein